jgi:hypothetical protein
MSVDGIFWRLVRTRGKVVQASDASVEAVRQPCARNTFIAQLSWDRRGRLFNASQARASRGAYAFLDALFLWHGFGESYCQPHFENSLIVVLVRPPVA